MLRVLLVAHVCGHATGDGGLEEQVRVLATRGHTADALGVKAGPGVISTWRLDQACDGLRKRVITSFL